MDFFGGAEETRECIVDFNALKIVKLTYNMSLKFIFPVVDALNKYMYDTRWFSMKNVVTKMTFIFRVSGNDISAIYLHNNFSILTYGGAFWFQCLRRWSKQI